MNTRKSLIILALVLALPAAAFAQKPVTEKVTATIKATIDAIDHDSRLITLKGPDGNYETVYAGPEMKRFDELKVGDKVTFKITESVAYQIRKPGEPAAATPNEASIMRHPTEKPSGTITEQETATVTIKAIDMKVPSVTVTSEDGRTMSFKVKDKGNLKGVNPGDKVIITYTTAMLISVE
jgi:Cu/Ag efflux protein CusF